MSFVNELFERLKASTTANDVQAALASLNSIQDPNERARAARETIALISRFANELLERGQFKNAAYQFYSGSQVIQNFLSDPNSEYQWLRSSADALAKASQEHVSWDDLLGGAACMTISSLLRIQTGDWDVNQHLDAFVKAHDFSADQSATACLYIPYDLAGAANPANPNPSLLQRATGYTESYLLNTKPAAMFQDGIKRALEVTRQTLMDYVKFPSIRAIYEFDHDIIFGEEFKFTFKLENKGEGAASEVAAHISIPSGLTVVTGTDSISITNLDSGARKEVEFTLICPSGEGQEEITVEIPVSVNYQDILANQNSISLGSALIPIKSEKRGEKLLNQLIQLKDAISERMTPLESLSNPEIQPLITSFNTIMKKIGNTAETNIQNGEFSAAGIGINQLEQIEEFIQQLADFLIQYSEHTQSLIEAVQDVKEDAECLLKSLDEVQKQLSS
ncbi:MAG: CARDB domain-containing protein [Candidatus Hermodarchaeota archaeon]